jgi:hypothetical protein
MAASRHWNKFEMATWLGQGAIWKSRGANEMLLNRRYSSFLRHRSLGTGKIVKKCQHGEQEVSFLGWTGRFGR